MTIDNTKLHNLEDAAKKAATGVTDGKPLQDALNALPHNEVSAYMAQYEKDRGSDKGLPPGHYDSAKDQIVFEPATGPRVYDYSNYMVGPKDFKENTGEEIKLAVSGPKKVDTEAVNVAAQINKITDESQKH